MGNKFICMTKKDSRIGGKRVSKSNRSSKMDEELLHRQALAMAIQQHQLSQRFENGSMSMSMSRRIGSTSSRRRPINSYDSFFNSNNKELSQEFLENIKTKKFVMLHGGGFGAWCWYKNIVLLEESGLFPIVLDLTGSGMYLTDTNTVTTLADYSKPLVDFLEKLPEYEKLGSVELFSPESKSLIYGNGKDNPRMGFMFEKQQMHGLYFNQSPAKDVALAMVSMRLIPLGPMMETLSLSADKYKIGRRFYIQTLYDRAISHDVQKNL